MFFNKKIKFVLYYNMFIKSSSVTKKNHSQKTTLTQKSNFHLIKN